MPARPDVPHSRTAWSFRRGALAFLPPRLRPEATLGVLDVTKYFGTASGGIKTYLLEKARFVASRPALRQVMVVPGAEDGIDTAEGSRIYRLRGPRIPAHPPYRFLLATGSFRRIVEHERPDLIEIGSPFAVPWLTRLANRRHAAPMVWYYHSHLPRLAAPDPLMVSAARRLASRALARYVRILGSGFPLVICASRFAAEALEDLRVPRIARVPLGVDLDHFHPARRSRARDIRLERGLPDGPLALFIGRFAREKRIEVVLEAWPEIERRTGLRLALMGDGPDAGMLRRHPHAGRVAWLPWEQDRSRIADLLAAVDLYVAPGPVETFGLSVLEAMASGVPVLAVDAGAGAELVAGSGAGLRYEDGQPESVVAAAVSLAEEDLPELGRRARAYAERHHAWNTVLERMFELYGGLLAGRPIAS